MLMPRNLKFLPSPLTHHWHVLSLSEVDFPFLKLANGYLLMNKDLHNFKKYNFYF